MVLQIFYITTSFLMGMLVRKKYVPARLVLHRVFVYLFAIQCW